MNISELYSTFGIISIVFNIGLAVFTYNNKKGAKEAQVEAKSYKEIVVDISNIISRDFEEREKDKRNLELITDLLNSLNNIEKKLRLLKKDDQQLKQEGLFVISIVNEIDDTFSNIRNNSFIFDQSDFNYNDNIHFFNSIIKKYTKSSTSNRKLMLEQMMDINGSFIKFLRKIKHEI